MEGARRGCRHPGASLAKESLQNRGVAPRWLPRGFGLLASAGQGPRLLPGPPRATRHKPRPWRARVEEGRTTELDAPYAGTDLAVLLAQTGAAPEVPTNTTGELRFPNLVELPLVYGSFIVSRIPAFTVGTHPILFELPLLLCPFVILTVGRSIVVHPYTS